jgi:tetratricopeptide (TPR) repeat protein
MIDEMHALLKQVAGQTDTPLVDAEPDQIAGFDRFMDHVHPTIGSHQQIGRTLADKAEEIGLVESNRRWTEADRRRAYRNHFRRLGPVYLANGRRRVGWLENWARRERLDEETVPVDAQGHLRLGMKLLDLGEIDAAWREMLLAMGSEPDLIDQVLTHAVTLFAQGRPDLAQEVLLRLHQQSQAGEHRAAIKRAYVTIAFECGDTEIAARTFATYRDEIERAVSEDGGSLDGVPDVLEELAELTAAGGDALSAGQYADPFLAPTSLSPDAVRVYSARKHLADHDYDAAVTDVTRAIELAPENVEAYKLRAILRMVQSNLEGAIDDLTTAIELEPNASELLRLRAAARRRLGQDAQADADLKQANQLGPPSN